ncbi:MAG: general stress protein [Dethiobacteria bacterium]
MAKAIIGVFRSQERAKEAINELKSQGFDEKEISLVAREKKGEGYGEEGEGNERLTMERQNLGEGIFTGGALGGITGLLAGAGALLIPGIGPIVAAGPLAAFLTGIVGGGLVGGLVDFGIPEERGRHFEERVKRGDILVSVKTEDDKVQQVISTLNRYGAEDVESH